MEQPKTSLKVFKIIQPKEKDLKGKKFFGKFEIIKAIGKSAYSSVFLGKYINEKKYVAIKVQIRNSNISSLEKEAYFQFMLKGIGIPRVISYGVIPRYNILVETLLGKTIQQLFKINQNAQIKMKDLCMVAIQIIDRIQFIHSKNIVHQDIKPENFLVGNPNSSIIYIIDFGLSKKYRSSRTGKHISFSKTKKFNGTLKFSSINCMKGIEMTRRDDLESTGYMLIYLIRGNLPWSQFENNNLGESFEKTYQMKSTITNQELCKYLPKEFCYYMDYVKSLKFEENPNYLYLRSLFFSILDKMNDKYDLKFSWIKNTKDINNNLKMYKSSLLYSLNDYKRKKKFPLKNIFSNIKEIPKINNLFNTKNESIDNLKFIE